jgi:hypothetical protein
MAHERHRRQEYDAIIFIIYDALSSHIAASIASRHHFPLNFPLRFHEAPLPDIVYAHTSAAFTIRRISEQQPGAELAGIPGHAGFHTFYAVSRQRSQPYLYYWSKLFIENSWFSHKPQVNTPLRRFSAAASITATLAIRIALPASISESSVDTRVIYRYFFAIAHIYRRPREN